MGITKQDRALLQAKFGKGNYRLKWNHGGHSIYVKQTLEFGGKPHFNLFAYDAEAFIKTLREEN